MSKIIPTQFEAREGYLNHFCQSATYKTYGHLNEKVNIESLKIEIGMQFFAFCNTYAAITVKHLFK